MAKNADERKATNKRRVDALVHAARPREDHFYRLLFDYLQLAHESDEPAIKEAMNNPWRGRPPRGWGDVRGRSFDTWLEENKWELGEPCTRLLDSAEKARPGEITIAVRLDRAVKLIREELVARFMHQFSYLQRFEYYKPIPEDKLQCDALRDYWIWYRADQHARARGKKDAYVSIVCKFYKEQREKYPYINPDKKRKNPTIGNARRVTNDVSRAVRYANAIVHNVVQGRFPGIYNEQTRKTWLKKEIAAAKNEFDEFSWIARRLVFNKGNVDSAEVSNSLRDHDPYW